MRRLVRCNLWGVTMARPEKSHDPLRWLDSPQEVIRLVVMMLVRYPLSLHNV